MRNLFLHVAPLLFGATLSPWPSHADIVVLFGTHQTGSGAGFTLAHFDPVTGTLARPEFVKEADAPSFFVIHPDRRRLYACNSIDTYQGKPEGSVSAYAVDPQTGRLALLDVKPAGGAGPCFVSLDRKGRFLLDANYNGGNVCVYAIRPDGGLGERTAFVQHTNRSVNPQRQAGPHPHSIVVDPGNQFALVPDLGADRVFVYHFSETTGALTPNDPPAAAVNPGAGPRHLAFHPNAKLVYLINELSSAVTAFHWDAERGVLTEFQTITTLPAGFTGHNTAAEIAVHPNGRFLYASNRGHDSLAVFAIDQDTGRLTRVEDVFTGGNMPRNFAFDPSGQWLLVANHDSDNAVVFRADSQTGRLTRQGEPLCVPNPFCLRFLR